VIFKNFDTFSSRQNLGGRKMKNLILLLILFYSVGSQAQEIDFGELFVESLENLEAELVRAPGCGYTNEDGQITFSSDDEDECDQVKSQAKKSLRKFKRAVRNNFRDNLDMGRARYNIARKEFKCRVLDIKIIRDLGLGSTIGEDTQQLLCCEGRVTVKTKDFSEYEAHGLIRAGLEISRGEEFKAGLEVRGESTFESSTGSTESRGFLVSIFI